MLLVNHWHIDATAIGIAEDKLRCRKEVIRWGNQARMLKSEVSGLEKSLQHAFRNMSSSLDQNCEPESSNASFKIRSVVKEIDNQWHARESLKVQMAKTVDSCRHHHYCVDVNFTRSKAELREDRQRLVRQQRAKLVEGMRALHDAEIALDGVVHESKILISAVPTIPPQQRVAEIAAIDEEQECPTLPNASRKEHVIGDIAHAEAIQAANAFDSFLSRHGAHLGWSHDAHSHFCRVINHALCPPNTNVPNGIYMKRSQDTPLYEDCNVLAALTAAFPALEPSDVAKHLVLYDEYMSLSLAKRERMQLWQQRSQAQAANREDVLKLEQEEKEAAAAVRADAEALALQRRRAAMRVAVGRWVGEKAAAARLGAVAAAAEAQALSAAKKAANEAIALRRRQLSQEWKQDKLRRNAEAFLAVVTDRSLSAQVTKASVPRTPLCGITLQERHERNLMMVETRKGQIAAKKHTETKQKVPFVAVNAPRDPRRLTQPTASSRSRGKIGEDTNEPHNGDAILMRGTNYLMPSNYKVLSWASHRS